MTRLTVFRLNEDSSTGHGERKKEEVDRRSGKTILHTGQGWSLPAQLGQLKKGQDGKRLRSHTGAPTT